MLKYKDVHNILVDNYNFKYINFIYKKTYKKIEYRIIIENHSNNKFELILDITDYKKVRTYKNYSFENIIILFDEIFFKTVRKQKLKILNND